MTNRCPMSLGGDPAARCDQYIEAKGYTNRSEAVRDLIRERLTAEHLEGHYSGHCIASLSYVYNHHERELAARLMDIQHDHHDLTLATQHIHLDHDNCLETVMLRGPMRAVRSFAEALIAERGIRHGNLHLVPVELTDQHTHDDEDEAHTHSKPII